MKSNLKLSFLVLLVHFQVLGQVNFNNSITIENVKLYGDILHKNLFYYGLEGMELVKKSDGNDDFRIIIMRYTGRKLSADQQAKIFKNICQFKVKLKEIDTEKLNKIRENQKIILKKLPLTHVKPFLIFSPINFEEKAKIIDNEHITDESGILSEQDITINLSNFDAQLVEAAFQKHQTLLSVGYTIYSEGAKTEAIKTQEITDNLNPKFNTIFNNYVDSIKIREHPKKVLLLAGAIEISLPKDYNKYIMKVDLNEQIPAEFASIDVRCYDFNNELRSDIYAKKVVIEASSINDVPIQIEEIFYRKFPQIYLKTLKFSYAVKADKPLRYRVIEIDNTGKYFVKGWINILDWSLIDITNK